MNRVTIYDELRVSFCRGCANVGLPKDFPPCSCCEKRGLVGAYDAPRSTRPRNQDHNKRKSERCREKWFPIVEEAFPLYMKNMTYPDIIRKLGLKKEQAHALRHWLLRIHPSLKRRR